MELQGDDGQRLSQETFPEAKFSKFVELGIKDINVLVMNCICSLRSLNSLVLECSINRLLITPCIGPNECSRVLNLFSRNGNTMKYLPCTVVAAAST